MHLVPSRVLLAIGIAAGMALVASCSVSVGGSGSKAGTAALEFTSATRTVDEGGGSILITVSRIASSAGAISVDYASVDNTATAGSDYTATGGSLIWASGDGTDKSFILVVVDDAAMEGDEALDLVLWNPSPGAVLGAQSTCVVTIVDNDTPPAGALQFGGPSFSVDEADPTAAITVTRTGGSVGAISVDFATSDNSAMAPGDYASASGTLNWADGDSAVKTFAVNIVNDTLAEGAEAIDLALSNPVGGAVIGTQNTAILMIIDNDTFGILEFSAATFSIGAYGGSIDIAVRRVAGSTGAVTVDYSTVANTATAGSDFVPASGMLSWNDGETTDKTFTVTIVDDTLLEGDETVDLVLSNPGGGANLSALSTAVLTIQEGWLKDVGNPVFSPAAPGAWDDGDVDEPWVLGPASGLPQYMMWYVGADQAGTLEAIGHAWSTDGLTWSRNATPVLNPGPPGSWDESEVSGPCVVWDSSASTFWMYFNGSDAAGNLQVGLANSSDGISWAKHPSNPIFTPGSPGSWDAGAVGYVSVVQDGALWKMWHTGVDVFGPGSLVQIGYATSSDGVTWTRHPSSPVMTPDPTSFEAQGVGFPRVIEDGSPTFRMLYTGNVSVIGSVVQRIGYALSTDGGVSWTKYQDSAGLPWWVLDVGMPGDWDEATLFIATWESAAAGELWFDAENTSGVDQIGHATHP